MNSLGRFIDEVSILKLREHALFESVMHDSLDAEAREAKMKALVDVKITMNDLIAEIDSYIGLVITKRIVLDIKPQHKLYYDKKDNIPEIKDIGKNIELLLTANMKLWEIEDCRRNLFLPDSERLRLADSVSVFNQKRNMYVDRINFLFSEKISKV